MGCLKEKHNPSKYPTNHFQNPVENKKPSTEWSCQETSNETSKNCSNEAVLHSSRTSYFRKPQPYTQGPGILHAPSILSDLAWLAETIGGRGKTSRAPRAGNSMNAKASSGQWRLHVQPFLKPWKSRVLFSAHNTFSDPGSLWSGKMLQT